MQTKIITPLLKTPTVNEVQSVFASHGVTGLTIRVENSTLILEQRLGSGIKGLGYDRNEHSFWLCLNQGQPESVSENARWDANTILSAQSKFSGIKITLIAKNKYRIIIQNNHPVAVLAKYLNKENSVYLPGEYNNWNRTKNPFKLNNDTGALEVVIDWDGSPMECKIALADVEANWSDGGWRNGFFQRMEIR